MRNKNVLKRYMNYLIANKQAVSSVRNKVETYGVILNWLGDRSWQIFRKEEQFNSCIVWYGNGNRNERTTEHAKVLLRTFLKWFFRANPPKYLRHITVKRYETEVDETQLWKPSEVRKLIDVAVNARDRALISVLYESAARINELLNVRIEDIEFQEHMTVVRLENFKTQGKRPVKRRVPIFESTPYLIDWINHHPDGKNRRAPLFVSLATNYLGNRLFSPTVNKRLTHYAKKAGINRKIWPHILRHSKITYWAQVENLNEQDLRYLCGWLNKSDMPQAYTHYGFSGVASKLLRNRGLVTEVNEEVEREKVALKNRPCPRCDKVNPSGSIFCNCGMSLSMEGTSRIEKLKSDEAVLLKSLLSQHVSADTDVLTGLYDKVKGDPKLLELLRSIARDSKVKQGSDVLPSN